jgi:hypothetical protein
MIVVPNPEVADLAPDAYEVIGEKVTYRLAQRPGAYVVLKYVRQVIKLKETQAIHCPGSLAVTGRKPTLTRLFFGR